MGNYCLKFIILFISLILLTPGYGQENQNTTDTAYVFKSIYENPATPVKNQASSGTCWDFAGISFIESELLRMEKGEYDLSEMYVVRCIYPVKADKYVRNHGRSNFSMGGQAHDVTDIIGIYGIVPEEVYPGFVGDFDKHNHGELDALLKGFCDVVIRKRSKEITTVWLDAYNAVLDVYLGEMPETFDYEGNTYTPNGFLEYLNINKDDYIELTSYTNYPMYEQVCLEIPDNWTNSLYYNIPLDELIEVMEYALKNGYTMVWDGDVSDRNFSFTNGVAIVPEKDWKDKTEEEKDNTCLIPEQQKNITQKIRQRAFDGQTSTDDHLMHITGMVEDQHGVKYFITKNSWGTNRNEFGGYLNMSEPYVRLRTIAIMLNKEALPPKLAKKLRVE